MKVLCAADLHLGRRSSKLPPTLDGREHSCVAAWQAIVQIARNEQVDLVTLSGDVVDRENRYFEAIGPLEQGVRELADAGITTLAITGNHDFDVLPHVADTFDSPYFRVLGLGGQWERYTLERDGKRLHIDGWSFPQQQVRSNPLDSYDLPHDETPVLGLLHGDLDQPESVYGPVRLEDLRRTPVTFWALGHIHAPAIHEQSGSPTVCYPGSPQAMDPGEQGQHGAVIVEINGSGSATVRRVSTSSVLYTTLSVDLSGIDTDDAVRSRLVTALRETLARESIGAGHLKCVSCRVTVVGRTPLHSRIGAILDDAEDVLHLQGAGGVEAFVERIDVQTRPALDLDTLSKRPDLPGELARVIQALEADSLDGEYQDLVQNTVRQLQDLHINRTFVPISDDAPPAEDDARRYLLAEAWTLLDTLIQQREAA